MIDMTTHLDRLTPLMYALTRGGGRYRLGRVRIVEVHPRSDIVGGTQTQLHRLIGNRQTSMGVAGSAIGTTLNKNNTRIHGTHMGLNSEPYISP